MSRLLVNGYLPAWSGLAYKDRIQEVNMSKATVSHKSEMAGLQ